MTDKQTDPYANRYDFTLLGKNLPGHFRLEHAGDYLQVYRHQSGHHFQIKKESGRFVIYGWKLGPPVPVLSADTIIRALALLGWRVKVEPQSPDQHR